MQTRTLGRTGHQISEIGFGAWQVGADWGDVDEDTAILLSDAQTSGGLLLAGEIPGAPVVGELVPRRDGQTIVVR